MEIKHQILLTRKTIYAIMLLGIFLFAFLGGNLPSVRAQDAAKYLSPTNVGFAPKAATADGFDFPICAPNLVGCKLDGGFGSSHPGQDMNGACPGGGNCDLNWPVNAAANGLVVYSAWAPGTTWGNIVMVEHTLPDGAKIWSQYAHLARRDVEVGNEVSRGQQIGTIGRGYNDQYYAHLHFEIRIQSINAYAWITDPNIYLQYYTNPVDFINSHRTIDPGIDYPPSGYSKCAEEYGQCTFGGIADVVYGARNSFSSTIRFTNVVDCVDGVFGDPLAGTLKACYYRSLSTAAWVPNGTVIKGSGYDLYLYSGGAKHWIPSMAILASYGYSSNQIVTLPDDNLINNLPSGPAVNFHEGTLIMGTTASVYLVIDGQKREFSTWDTLTGMGYDGNDIFSVTDEDLSRLPTGTPISTPLSQHPAGTTVQSVYAGAVYLLEDTQSGIVRRLFPSWETLLSWGYNGDRIVTISDAEMNSYPFGANLNFRDGALVKGSTADVYVVVNQTLRGIGSREVFDKFGYAWPNILTVPDFLVTPIGPAMNPLSISPNLLTVNKAGAGSGTVASDPTGINCGADCSENYDYNTSITLTATPVTGSSFTGWSDACNGTGTCTVSMTAAKSVTATFIQNEYTLTITSAHGTVARNPSRATYHEGDVVQLTATPTTGWGFANWTGNLTGTANPGSVTIHGNTTVTANYTFNNQAPTDITISNSSVFENLPIGTTVGTFTTIDPNPSDTHTYSFACTVPGADNLFFTFAGNVLKTASVFDFETKSSYHICIRTDDGNGGIYDKAFIITIMDVNDNPIYKSFLPMTRR